MSGFNVLDPTVDLKRNYFLEASAGTGKTFTIENIVVRLLQDGFEMDQILVVTFTRAATLELKLRIRRNLDELLLTSHQTSIRKALMNFDRAQIYTIHGFCFQLLQEFALETGFPIHQNEESLPAEILKMLIKDFLRTSLIPEEIHLRQLEKVLKKYQGNIDKISCALMRPYPVQGRKYGEIWKELQSHIASFSDSVSVDQLISLAPRFGGLCDRKRQLKPDYKQGMDQFIQLLAGAEIQSIDFPLLKMVPDNLLRNQNYPELLENLNQNIIPLLTEMAHLPSITGRLATMAQEYVYSYCQKEDLFLYDDLLKRLHQELKNPLFCQQVRSKYRAVLIDEFQDTDALQWDIFSTLFLNHMPLYLVGDPKQSIYRFRGADLYTYREAKEALGKDCYATLNLNFRSQPGLIHGLNALFRNGQELITLPKIGECIPIEPIEAALKSTALSGIIFCRFEKEEDLFSYIFQEIERIRQRDQTPYRAFAILVKDRYQAKRLTAQCPLPFVNKRNETLAESEALIALEDLLVAIYYPREKNRVIKALGGPLFGLEIAELANIEEKSLLFFHYHHILRSQGLITLFHLLQEELIFPSRSFYLDFLQLIEVIAENASGIEEYLPFLEKLKREDPEADILKARAKSDQEAIQVMTLHVSKGLEFDIVFPVALMCSYEMDDQEERSEKMRQLYVALTRAKRFLYLPLSDQNNTPIHVFLSQILQGRPLTSFIQDNNSFSLIDIPPRSVQKQELHNLSINNFQCAKKNQLTFKPQFAPCTISSFTSLADKKEYDPDHRRSPLLPEDGIPPGRQTGTLLHHIFEKLDFKIMRSELGGFLEPYLKKSGLATWQQSIENLIWNTLHHPLVTPSATFSLADLDLQKMIREMEFFYPSRQGYLKGFIDLFFEYQNRFYIIDWKSNTLENYGQTSLEEAIKEHQYDLQAKIYTKAARKYLKIFNKQKQFGGVFYLFLRGLNSKNDDGVYFLYG